MDRSGEQRSGPSHTGPRVRGDRNRRCYLLRPFRKFKSSRSSHSFVYSCLAAPKSDIQRPRTLCQGWYLFLVRATHFRSLDGLFCRARLGLEHETSCERGRVEEGVRAVRRICGVVPHLSLRLDEYLPRTSCRLGSSMVCPRFGARVHRDPVLWWRLGMFDFCLTYISSTDRIQCGMLVESRRVLELLHTSIIITSLGSGVQEPRESWHSPRTYSISLNPLPGLVILLLGFMMSSHHQESMVSTMLHAQWGTMLMGSSLARAVTYLLAYLSPPTSFLPSRPPSEILCAFCLISGGLIFMASVRHYMLAVGDFH